MSTRRTQTNVQFSINATQTKDQWQPAVAANEDGQFMSVWTSRDQDGAVEGVFNGLFGVTMP